MENMTLSDIAAVTGNGTGFGGNNGLMFLLLIVFLMNGGAWNRGVGEFGQYATAASQQDILFGQKFSDLDNKMDRLGNGIADLGYANLQNMNAMQTALGGAIVSEGRAMADKMCELKTAVHAEGEATRAMIQQNKIDSLTAQVNELKMAQNFCGIPRINPYGYQVVPNPTVCGCNCGNI